LYSYSYRFGRFFCSFYRMGNPVCSRNGNWKVLDRFDCLGNFSGFILWICRSPHPMPPLPSLYGRRIFASLSCQLGFAKDSEDKYKADEYSRKGYLATICSRSFFVLCSFFHNRSTVAAAGVDNICATDCRLDPSADSMQSMLSSFMSC